MNTTPRNSSPSPNPAEQRITVTPARFVTVALASIMIGLTEKAIERKIEKGEWADGIHYRKRGGRVYIDMKGFEKWVEAA